MSRNSAFFLFALCPLIPITARFGYGIIVAVSFLCLFFMGIFFRELSRKIGAGDIGPFIELGGLAGSSSLLFLLLRSFSPVLAISLGMYIYLSAVSYLMLVSIDRFSLKTFASGGLFSFIPFVLGFSALRELMGYGMLTVPLNDGLHEIVALPYFSFYGISFWGTAGGALILLGLITWGVKFITRRVSSAGRLQ